MIQETVNALKEVDGFHKTCALLFDDIEAAIQRNPLTASMSKLLGPERWYAVEGANRSEHRGNFLFDHDGRIRFVFMLVKTHENYLRGKSPGFEAICQHLKVDVLFPLLLVTGVFEPREVPPLTRNGWTYRRWLDGTLQLDLPNNDYLPDPSA
jgi:hypothetical protein